MKQTLPDIKTNFSDWYNDIVYKAELADLSPVRGSIVIRPYGYALWENIKEVLDKKIKETGHQNAAFPLLIPLSFLQKEAKHVAGFAPELAVVTNAGGKELEEPLVVRPTSETIIHYMFAQWIKSWRDLPMKINQWCNVVRWEMRTRPFLRTSEFFWQEGHTAHETAQEALEEALLMLKQYVDVYEQYLAIPVVPGKKSASERFAGADETYTVEGLMQDGKALQMCTSHLISQNFAKSFGMTFQDRHGNLAYPFLTSWGFTTRSVGAVVMVHGDQKGLIMPPKAAPIQVVIVPIFKSDSEKDAIKAYVAAMVNGLKGRVRVHVDDREEETPGAKFYAWELKGVPLRIEVGPRDMAQQEVVMVNRLTGAKEKVPVQKLAEVVEKQLQELHEQLYKRALEQRNKQWHVVDNIDLKALENEGGFYQTGWCGASGCEEQVKVLYKATIRCLLEEKKVKRCFACQAPSSTDILIARAY